MSFARMTSFRQKQKKIRRKKFKAFDYFISFGHFLSATVLQRDNEQKKKKLHFYSKNVSLQKCQILQLWLHFKEQQSYCFIISSSSISISMKKKHYLAMYTLIIT